MTPDIERYKNILIVTLYLTLFLITKTSEIGGNYWKVLMKACIGGSILFFISDAIVTSPHYSYKLQHKLTFYMIFPAVISLVLYNLNEYNKAYNFIMINIIISIVYITIGIIAIVGLCILHFHEKYTQKKKIICDICKQTYIIRAKEHRKHMDYVNLSKYKSLEDKPIITCKKCFYTDPRFKNSKIVNNEAPDFTKINHKAKQLVEKRVTTEIDGQKGIPQVLDVEVDP